MTFDSKAPQTEVQHTINGIQFAEGHAHLDVLLGATEEWTIMNTTNNVEMLHNIDHPLHIHINPFQVTEFFDPNETLTSPETGEIVRVRQDGKEKPVFRYFLTGETKLHEWQCELDPKDPTTWREGGKVQVGATSEAQDDACGKKRKLGRIWWDVLAIPSGRVPKDANGERLKDSEGKEITIAGYYKMRSRFVDYPGLYVMHCHILIHEDRGMMYSVEVLKSAALVRHH